MANVFVFGSNRQGRHGAGAAHTAMILYGAEYGKAEGRQGNSYAIVTKELRSWEAPVTLPEIYEGVKRFKQYAEEHLEDTFQITRIGCGLAGFDWNEIAPMFDGMPTNCQFI
jgi:hypothetical protein